MKHIFIYEYISHQFVLRLFFYSIFNVYKVIHFSITLSFTLFILYKVYFFLLYAVWSITIHSSSNTFISTPNHKDCKDNQHNITNDFVTKQLWILWQSNIEQRWHQECNLLNFILFKLKKNLYHCEETCTQNVNNSLHTLWYYSQKYCTIDTNYFLLKIIQKKLY